MRSLSRYVFLLACAPLLASCVFLLNYDDLQGDKPLANTGGTPAAGGSNTGGTQVAAAGSGAADAGNEGGAASCGDCDDHDACTIDTCDQTGALPVCAHEATEGLKLDGFETTLTSQHHARVSLAAGGQQFFFASLQVDKTTPKVSLYRLASDGTLLETVGTDLKLDGSPVSNVGLTIEELALGEVALHGFVATKLKLPNSTARVFHVVGKAGATTASVIPTSSYAEGNEAVFPQALSIGGKIVGAWIQADGTIAVHNVGTAKTDVFGTLTLPATTLALLSTADALPAVMFTAQANPQAAIATYVETSGQNRAKVVECETRPGDYLSSSVIGTQIPGLWLANVTRAGTGYLTTGGGTLACDKGMCLAIPEDCTKATSNGLRDLAGASVHFDDDAPGIVYSVAALPQIAAKSGDASAVEGRLSLVLSRADFSNRNKITSATVGGDPDNNGLMLIAHNDTSEALGFAGPDWPAVGILPTKQVAVAWIQPNPTAAGTELHVQRYKMCLPPPG